MSTSILEPKAKTILDLLNKWVTQDSHVIGGTYLNEKWVPLEEAKKEISELKAVFERNNAFSYQRIEALSKQIEAANKKLEEIALEIELMGVIPSVSERKRLPILALEIYNILKSEVKEHE